MITLDSILSIPKSDLEKASKKLDKDDISQLVEWLSLKEDNARYQAFLLLQSRSVHNSDVYPFWDTFYGKLKSENSYQRSIGLMLLAENVRWDYQNRIDNTIDGILALLKDEKPITVRQCIQSLGKIVKFKPAKSKIIADSLVSFDLMAVKDTMRKSILLDIINFLLEIRMHYKSDLVESFIL